jgi:hypothetical protein
MPGIADRIFGTHRAVIFSSPFRTGRWPCPRGLNRRRRCRGRTGDRSRCSGRFRCFRVRFPSGGPLPGVGGKGFRVRPGRGDRQGKGQQQGTQDAQNRSPAQSHRSPPVFLVWNGCLFQQPVSDSEKGHRPDYAFPFYHFRLFGQKPCRSSDGCSPLTGPDDPHTIQGNR